MPDVPQRHIADRVKQFLDDKKTDPELVREYLGLLLAEQRSLVSQINRSFGLMFLLATLFVLIAVQGVQELSIGGVKLGNLHFISALIPVVMAGLFARAAMLNARRSVVVETYNKLNEQVCPGLYQSDLDTLLIPNLFFVTSEPLMFGWSGRMKKVAEIAWIAEICVFIMLPIVFYVYAYIQIFSLLPVTSPPAWISFLLTVAMYSLAAFVLFEHMNAKRHVTDKAAAGHTEPMAGGA
ncbi:hypothetical protein ACFQZ4_16240 [Catellatospora coxensis]|uniref:Uncharacterized protein n=1 Tax=Catellatospora coxensis TaxID=310354 RepID=A0A8J3PBE1_9ACTN|nr:hypothetical protein [Catellatospora coxensis]GIG10802.1 hypothetical protein Cco03nite_75020 [Catellatospora coxensis]